MFWASGTSQNTLFVQNSARRAIKRSGNCSNFGVRLHRCAKWNPLGIPPVLTGARPGRSAVPRRRRSPAASGPVAFSLDVTSTLSQSAIFVSSSWISMSAALLCNLLFVMCVCACDQASGTLQDKEMLSYCCLDCGAAGAVVTANPLKNLSELPKTHYSWPIPAQYLASSAPYFIDGLMHDYVRITGACSLTLDVSTGGLNHSALRVCAEICEAVAPVRLAAQLPAPTINVNYSPWYKHFPGTDPTVGGAAEQAELASYAAVLAELKALLPTVGLGKTTLGAVLLDSEKFKYTSSSSPAYRQALTRKHDLIWNATRAAFPSVRIELYDRGAVSKWDTTPTWTVSPYYTLEERGESLSLSLYTVPEIWNMRSSMNHTVALAESARGNLSGTTKSVTPWISLGAGNRRLPKLDGTMYDLCWDYDRVYSWQMGREMNNAWYGTGSRVERYAPWNAAQVVVFYPSVFDVRGVHAGPGDRLTNFMQHFVNYVRGATGLDGLAPDNK
eukprot:COSAG02_NODE_424_length_22575_cov_79.088361_22_plen_501_part_00